MDGIRCQSSPCQPFNAPVRRVHVVFVAQHHNVPAHPLPLIGRQARNVGIEISVDAAKEAAKPFVHKSHPSHTSHVFTHQCIMLLCCASTSTIIFSKASCVNWPVSLRKYCSATTTDISGYARLSSAFTAHLNVPLIQQTHGLVGVVKRRDKLAVGVLRRAVRPGLAARGDDNHAQQARVDLVCLCHVAVVRPCDAGAVTRPRPRSLRHLFFRGGEDYIRTDVLSRGSILRPRIEVLLSKEFTSFSQANHTYIPQVRVLLVRLHTVATG